MRSGWMMVLAGCGGLAEGEVGQVMRPPPAWTPPAGVVRTVPVQIDVAGLTPGSTAYAVWGTAMGAGPCLGVIGGQCLGVIAPRLLGLAQVDGSGAASIGVVPDPSLPPNILVQVANVGGLTPPASVAVTDPAVWRPAAGTSWQWQLQGAIDTSVDVDMYDVDLFDTSQAVVDALHADGRTVMCYFSAGSWENWRPDAGAFPPAARGRALDGWPGERWLDIRAPAVRAAMLDRLDLAVNKACDGVEPDNVDGYANPSGFPLVGADQLAFNRFLASEAHRRGLSIGLKNDLGQIGALVGWFDWALNEECFAYHECARLQPFVDDGKAVFHVEYPAAGQDPAALAATVCAAGLPFSTLIKPMDLGPARVACPGP